MKKAKTVKRSSVSRDPKTVDAVSDPAEKRRLLIVKKAARLFIKKGYSQTTMRDISRATDINLGNLYNYIDSKEDILCLSFENYHDPAMEWFEREGIMELDDPRQQLEKSVHQMLVMIHGVMNEILMMYRETRVLPPKFMKIVLQKENNLISVFEKIIAGGAAKKVFHVQDPFFAANMLVFQLSLFPLRSWNLKKYTREEYLDLAQETIIKAIISDTE
jgi:AcrR family transcriptional regulator